MSSAWTENWSFRPIRCNFNRIQQAWPRLCTRHYNFSEIFCTASLRNWKREDNDHNLDDPEELHIEVPDNRRFGNGGYFELQKLIRIIVRKNKLCSEYLTAPDTNRIHQFLWIMLLRTSFGRLLTLGPFFQTWKRCFGYYEHIFRLEML